MTLPADNRVYYTMIKDCKMDWETGRHSFTFVTGDDRVTALDSLTDLIESLLDIHHEIVKTTDDEMPYSYKVEGGVTHTNIKTHTYIKTLPRVWNE